MFTLLKLFTWFPSWCTLELLECIVPIWKPVTHSSIFVELLELPISIALREAVTAIFFAFDWLQSKGTLGTWDVLQVRGWMHRVLGRFQTSVSI